MDSAREALTIILNDFPGNSRFVLMRCEVEEKSGNFTVVERVCNSSFYFHVLVASRESDEVYEHRFVYLLLSLL